MNTAGTACTTCKKGFKIDGIKCVIANCTTADSDGYCTTCDVGFELKEKLCQPKHCNLFK